jgi:hypothetical protein
MSRTVVIVAIIMAASIAWADVDLPSIDYRGECETELAARGLNVNSQGYWDRVTECARANAESLEWLRREWPSVDIEAKRWCLGLRRWPEPYNYDDLFRCVLDWQVWGGG